MKKLFLMILCGLISLSPLSSYAISSPDDEETQVVEEKADKKGKKDKKKKEKKKKERRNPQEIIDDLKSIEWEKPAPSGDAAYDDMFKTADEFITMLRNVDDYVTIYSIRIITNESGVSRLGAYDNNGNFRSKKEANAQTLAAVEYGTSVGLTSATLAVQVAANAINIGQDAIPFVGDPKRKKANMQIAKATKGFKLLQELIGTQRKIMEKYLETNSDLSSGDVDVEALAEMNVDVNDIINVSDDEFNALWEQENGE